MPATAAVCRLEKWVVNAGFDRALRLFFNRFFSGVKLLIPIVESFAAMSTVVQDEKATVNGAIEAVLVKYESRDKDFSEA